MVPRMLPDCDEHLIAPEHRMSFRPYFESWQFTLVQQNCGATVCDRTGEGIVAAIPDQRVVELDPLGRGHAVIPTVERPHSYAVIDA